MEIEDRMGIRAIDFNPELRLMEVQKWHISRFYSVVSGTFGRGLGMRFQARWSWITNVSTIWHQFFFQKWMIREIQIYYRFTTFSNPFHKLLPLCIESDKIKAERIGRDLYIQVQLTRVERNPVTRTHSCFNGDCLQMFTSPVVFVHIKVQEKSI